MSIKINRINSYNDILVIDKGSGNGQTIFNKFIDALKQNNIISTDYNKIKFLKRNVCIIYNINDASEEYDQVIQFSQRYENKLEENNINVVLIKKDLNITVVDNVITCHSSLIKNIMELRQFRNTIDTIISTTNISFSENILQEIIRELIVNIVREGKLNGNCFNHTVDGIVKFIHKNSLHERKTNAIEFLDKTVIIYDYKKNDDYFERDNNGEHKVFVI